MAMHTTEHFWPFADTPCSYMRTPPAVGTMPDKAAAAMADETEVDSDLREELRTTKRLISATVSEMDAWKARLVVLTELLSNEKEVSKKKAIKGEMEKIEANIKQNKEYHMALLKKEARLEDASAASGTCRLRAYFPSAVPHLMSGRLLLNTLLEGSIRLTRSLSPLDSSPPCCCRNSHSEGPSTPRSSHPPTCAHQVHQPRA